VKKITVSALAVLIALHSIAQDTRSKQTKKSDKSEKRERMNTIIKQEEEGDVSFRKHSIFGFKIATDGYGIAYEIGKFRDLRRTSVWQFELNEKFHPKEEKVGGNSVDFFNNAAYKPAKANNFYQLKGGYGEQFLIGGKANKNGIAVSAVLGAGLSIGLVKPYYVDVDDKAGLGRMRYKFSDTVPTGTTYQILGASGFTVGWNELKVKPGIYAKTALRFDYNRFNDFITAVEAGINSEFYSSKILQMSWKGKSNIEQNYFFNAYIAIEFGKRK